MKRKKNNLNVTEKVRNLMMTHLPHVRLTKKLCRACEMMNSPSKIKANRIRERGSVCSVFTGWVFAITMAELCG